MGEYWGLWSDEKNRWFEIGGRVLSFKSNAVAWAQLWNVSTETEKASINGRLVEKVYRNAVDWKVRSIHGWNREVNETKRETIFGGSDEG